MKSFRKWSATGLAVLLGAAGCATSKTVKKAERTETAQLASAGDAKGYIDFFTINKDSAVRLYQIEEHQKQRLVGIFGLRQGRKAEVSARELTAPVSETLRVAVAPGQRTFRIEEDGKPFTVDVVEDKVTPVEVDYVHLDTAGLYEVYKVDWQFLEPKTESSKQANAKTE